VEIDAAGAPISSIEWRRKSERPGNRARNIKALNMQGYIAIFEFS